MVLTDERMPGMSGIELLAAMVDLFPDVVRVIVSAYSDAERVLRAINQGHAHEYVVKPWTVDDMRACIARGREVARRRRELRVRAELAEAMHEDLRRDHASSRMVIGSGAFAQAATAARRAAESESTVLLRGETGTGKELLARSIHDQSARHAGPFVRVDCASLAEGVLESELFGHERGAFTGAVRSRRGRFELADRGTIFLDEIGDISPHAQLALLRVLQEREVERVERDLRASARRLRDMISASTSESQMVAFVARADDAGLEVVSAIPQYQAGNDLVAWQVDLRPAGAAGPAGTTAVPDPL